MTDFHKIPAPSWAAQLASEMDSDYFTELAQFLTHEKQAGKQIYPPAPLLYNAFRHTPFDKVQLVIIGQDPYINEGQAMGLCFSVPEGCALPPSLKNIYKELVRDMEGFVAPAHGDLSSWAAQGVLLLNAVLSVEQGLSGSHAKKGWERFTDAVISRLNSEREELVFMLWGNYAKKKGCNIDRSRHLVLEAGHPSPLSVRYFRECGHFGKANQYLVEHGKAPINWQL